MNFVSNLNDVLNQIDVRLKNVDIDKMTREQATNVLALMRDRIHTDGQASNGGQIGMYSKGYLTVRSGAFKNSSKSDAGFYSKGNKAVFDIRTRKAVKIKSKKKEASTKGNTMRTMYNRGSDPKVILSLTRQMESDYVIVPVENGHGIGFSNAENYNKAMWNERRYKKEIFSMTESEEKKALEIAERYIADL